MKYIPQEMCQEGHWMVAMDDIDWVRDNEIIYRGSFQVVAARILGLSYPDYLKFLQANGGILKGKTGHPYAYFKDKAAAQRICNLLNKYWGELVKQLNE